RPGLHVPPSLPSTFDPPSAAPGATPAPRNARPPAALAPELRARDHSRSPDHHEGLNVVLGTPHPRAARLCHPVPAPRLQRRRRRPVAVHPGRRRVGLHLTDIRDLLARFATPAPVPASPPRASSPRSLAEVDAEIARVIPALSRGAIARVRASSSVR